MTAKKVAKKVTKKVAKKVAKKAVGAVNAGTKGQSAAILNFIKANEALIGNIDKPIDFIPSSSWIVDRVIGDGQGDNGPGGFPRGYMTEVYGGEGCGKTTLALHATAECQAAKDLVVYADFEKSLRAQRYYLKKLGVNPTDRNTFLHLEPNTLEEGTMLIFEAVVALKPALVVVDSLAAMVPAAFLTGDVTEAIKLGLHAKLVTVFVSTMNKVLQKTNTAMIFINQNRAKINTMGNGPKTDTTGGYAFKYYMILRLNMVVIAKTSSDAQSAITGNGTKEIVDQHVKITAVKNKLDKPFKSETLYIRFGYGIDSLKSLIDLGKKRGVLKGKSWLKYDSPNDESFNFNINGVKLLREHLEAHPEIIEDMMPMLFPKIDVEAYEKAKAAGDIAEDDMNEDMTSLMEEMSKNMSTANGAGSEADPNIIMED